MLQLGREMADERAGLITEKILAGLPKVWWSGSPEAPRIEAMHAAAAIARSTITKPETRERVLEEALVRLALRYEAGTDVEEIARRALEWKPRH